MENRRLIAGYDIRGAQSEDMEDVCAIATLAWARIHDSFRSIMGGDMHERVCAHWQENKATQARDQFKQHPDWFYVVVGEADGEIAGFVTFHLDEAKSLGTIRNNAIHPEHQGRGLGSAMYRHVLDRFKALGLQYAAVSTGLDEGHAPARRAYEKAGFNIRQENITYYMAL
jgi:ribosomal protein S18 acetylase RimI-like enzyme